MEPLDASTLANGTLVLLDSAPIIYVLEDHKTLARRFMPLFERHADGEIGFAITTLTVSEILVGPLSRGEETLAGRYRATLESWQVVELTVDIAERAARLRSKTKLRLPDAIQLASAMAINADALVTHDRDFSGVRGMKILS